MYGAVVVVAVVSVAVWFFGVFAGAATANDAARPAKSTVTSATLNFISLSFVARDSAD
jgi:hypothetical protein